MKILIDNGHGIETPGKRSPDGKFREYKYTREIAAIIVHALKQFGYDAELLVPEETDVPLKERVARINKWCSTLGNKNVIVVSVHVNAAANSGWSTATGWSCYTTKGKTKSDDLATELYVAAAHYLKSKRLRTDNTDGDPDLEENFYIIKNANCPAVLTENFFQDNKDDVAYLLSEEGRHAIVDLHIDGILTYLTTYA